MSDRAILKNDLVYVTNPSPRHAHMKGAQGRVVETKGGALKVRFSGGPGWFERGELSLNPAAGD